jgi:hypothetical protein
LYAGYASIIENTPNDADELITPDGRAISKNEQYLLKKLRSSSIDVQRMDNYLEKLGDCPEDLELQNMTDDEKFRRLVVLSAAN